MKGAVDYDDIEATIKTGQQLLDDYERVEELHRKKKAKEFRDNMSALRRYCLGLRRFWQTMW